MERLVSNLVDEIRDTFERGDCEYVNELLAEVYSNNKEHVRAIGFNYPKGAVKEAARKALEGFIDYHSLRLPITKEDIQKKVKFLVKLEKMHRELSDWDIFESILEPRYPEIKTALATDEPKVIWITGDAGTGKSTLLKKIRDEFAPQQEIHYSFTYQEMGKMIQKGLDAGIIFLDTFACSEPLKDFLTVAKWDVVVVAPKIDWGFRTDLIIQTEKECW